MPSGLPPPCGGISFTRRTKVFQIRAAERHTATIHSSLFTTLFPLAPPGGIPHPGKPAPLPENARELLPAGAGESVLWRPPVAERACGHLLPSHSSAPEESHTPAFPTLLSGIAKELLPAGAGGFPISWGYDKISAGAVGARFYTNKSGAKENHLCRELWVWPGRPLQNMI